MTNAWENFSYNFSTNEIAEDDSETQETLNKKIAMLVGNETERSLIDFLTNGGVYIRPLDEKDSFEYFTCRIDEEGNICLSGDTLNLNDYSKEQLLECADAQGISIDEVIERGCNTVSWFIEQNPMDYFSNIPNHTNELIDKLHEQGLFTGEFYHQNVFIAASEESQDGYAFYLKERGTAPEEEGIDFYYANGDIVGADCALDLIDYCKNNGLSLIGQDKDALINQTMMILGPELEQITFQSLMRISEMPDSLSGSVHKAYSELIKDYHKTVLENRHIVEDGISSMWNYNPDYREEPEAYFEMMTNIGEQIIKDRFEEKFAYDIAYEYLDEYGKSEDNYYEITEDNYEYDNGLMIILYDISPEEVEKDEDVISRENVSDTNFSVNIDDIHNGDIPDSFFDKIYTISDEFTKKAKQPDMTKD